ncbi:MAG: hypothetical protein GEU99_02420 [Luteitalea sp.]|nr:hypothetical protein [Luteitalea sp.]
MVWPVVDFRNVGSATYGGDALLNAWALAWNNHVVLDGAPSYFDANIFYPTRLALARSEHLFGISLFTLPIYATTRNPLLAYDLVWLASFPTCALAAFGLSSLVASRFVSRFIAGLVYAFAFFRFEHAIHIQLLWAFALPLSLLALHRWWESRSWASLTSWAALVTLQALTSWYLAVMCLLSNGLWLVWLCGRHRPRHGVQLETRRFGMSPGWHRAALSLVLAVAVIGAVLWWFARPYTTLPPSQVEEVLANVGNWRSYLMPPRATALGQFLAATGIALPKWSFETTNFLGFVPLWLALAGILSARTRHNADALRRGSVIAFFVALGLLAVVLSFGPREEALRSGAFDWTPYGWLARLPGMQAFRVPARFALLVVLSVAILSAAGAETIARWRRGGMLLWFAIPVLLLETLPVAYEIGRPHELKIPRVYTLLRGLPPGPVVSLPAFTLPPENWFEADYMLFSTVHWRPIMNGFSRSSPLGHRARMRAIAAFPAPKAVQQLRRLGVRYVVMHTQRYGVDLRRPAAAALRAPSVELIAWTGEDYLWRVGYSDGHAR